MGARDDRGGCVSLETVYSSKSAVSIPSIDELQPLPSCSFATVKHIFLVRCCSDPLVRHGITNVSYISCSASSQATPTLTAFAYRRHDSTNMVLAVCLGLPFSTAPSISTLFLSYAAFSKHSSRTALIGLPSSHHSTASVKSIHLITACPPKRPILTKSIQKPALIATMSPRMTAVTSSIRISQKLKYPM